MASPASTSHRSLDPGADPRASTQSPPAAAGEAVAIIQRDEFLLELGEALGGQVSLRPVETLAKALEQMAGARRAQTLLIDSRDATDLRADVDRAHAQAPHVPIIVFAPTESEKAVAGALKSSNVFAVLPIPVDARKTAAILEGALAEASAKRSAPRAAERPADLRASFRASVAQEAQSGTASPESDDEPPRKRLLVSAVVVIAIAVAAGAAIYWMHSRTPSSARASRLAAAAPAAGSTHARAPSPAATSAASARVTVPAGAGAASPATAGAGAIAAAPVAAQVPLVEGTVDTLLEKARLAMRERRYMAPADESALLYYRSALKVDPTNGEARDGLTRLAGLALSRFNDAMTAGRFDQAATDLADLKVAEPGDARLAPLEARLLQAEVASAFAASDFTRAAALVREAQQGSAASPGTLAKWRAELAQGETAARTARLASLIDQSIHAGHLLAPAGDSAAAYLEQLQSLAPDSAAAARGRRDVIAAYLARARDDAVAGKSSDADKWLSAARAAGMTAAELADYQSAVAQGQQRAAANEADQLATLARARIQSGNLIDPVNDSADYYLTQLKSAHGAGETVHSIGLELSSSLIAQATAAARAGKTDAMSADLAAARRWGADPVLIAAVEQIVNGPERSEQAAPASGPRIPAGYEPKRIRYVAPTYPQTALDAHESGTVTVEFTVDIYGKPRDVHVAASHPRGVFDYAAVSAVERWRFEPPIIDNVPTAIPTRMVIRFVAPN